jgi:hypothetical protein
MRLHNLLLLIWFFLAHVHVVKVNKHIFLIIKAIRPDYAQYTSDESEIDEDEAKNDDPDTDTEFDPFAKIESIIAPRKRFSKVLDYSAVANLRSTMLLEVDTISVIRSKLGDSALIIPVSPPFKVKGKSEASNISWRTIASSSPRLCHFNLTGANFPLGDLEGTEKTQKNYQKDKTQKESIRLFASSRC